MSQSSIELLFPTAAATYHCNMRFIFWTAVLLTTIICACSTVSMKQTQAYLPPPQLKVDVISGKDPVSVDHWLEKKFRETPTDSVRALTRYLQAKLWTSLEPTKACALWLDASQAPRFPLAHLARLHAMETCPADRGGFPSIEEVLSSTNEPWLKESAARAALARAIRIGDKRWEMNLNAEVARLERLQRDRVQRLQRAIQLATELNELTRAEEYRGQLKQIAPRFNDSPTADQWMAVATDFRQVREFEKARELYRKIVENPEANDLDKLKALDGIRMTFKLEKNTEKFLAATKEHSSFAKKNFFEKAKRSDDRSLYAKYMDAQLIYARAMWTEDATKEAMTILTRAEKEIRGKAPLEESVLVRARIEEEAGRFQATAKILSNVDANKVADRGLRAKILWYRAWNLRKAGRLKDAAGLLEKLAAEEAGTSLVTRDRFWLARTLKDAGDRERAAAEFNWLIENDPMGFYGLLAYRELKRPMPALTHREDQDTATEFHVPDDRAPASIDNALSPDDQIIAEWLIATQETDAARRFLDQATQSRRASFSENQTLDLLKLYARTGNYQTLYSRLSDLSPERRKNVLDSHPDLVFPQPWRHLVTDAAKKFGVQAELIYAIMRQESSFNPTARSPADAFGLMQLIPEAARRAEKASGFILKTPEDLYRPENNIPVGAAFIRELMHKWDDQFILTVASYNASEKAIAGWMKTRFRGDPLEFIEDIPYEETRNYVKLVMRNYVFYSRLNSREALLEFPERCLENLQDNKL